MINQQSGEFFKQFPTHLQQYPNKSLISRSKILKPPYPCFQQCCQIFVQFCYILLQYEIKKPLFVSQVLLSYNGYLYIVYSLNEDHSSKLLRVNRKQPLNQMFSMLKRLDLQRISKQDTRCSKIYRKMQRKLQKINLALENEQSLIEQTFSQEQGQKIIEFLSESQMFMEFAYNIRCSTVLLLYEHFNFKSKILDSLTKIIKSQQWILKYNGSYEFSKQYIQAYSKRILDYFQKLQVANKILIKQSKNDKENLMNFIITIPTKLTPYNSAKTETDHQESPQSDSKFEESYSSDISEQPDEKKSSQPNQITYQINIKYNKNQKWWEIDLLAESKWVIDLYNYPQFEKIWLAFDSQWGDIFDLSTTYLDYQPFKIELSSDKSISLREYRRIARSQNLLKHLILSIDRILMLFLLFSPILKLYYRQIQKNQVYSHNFLQKYNNPLSIQNLINQFKNQTKKYSSFLNQCS